MSYERAEGCKGQTEVNKKKKAGMGKQRGSHGEREVKQRGRGQTDRRKS